MAAARRVTIMVIPEGTGSRREYHVRVWIVKAALVAQVLIVVGIVLFFVFQGSLMARAAVASRLEKENERLLRYQYKVALLEDNLKQARDIVGRLTELAGIDFQLPELPDDSTLFASIEQPLQAVVPRPASGDMSLPSGLPIRGFVTQDFDITTDGHYHPGVDIACAEGTPVLATAKGIVVTANYDSTYGYQVLISHNDSVSTLYAHNLELLVESGQQIAAGSRIALSGNTGISSAPHVHYEVRIHNQPIDPLENLYYEKD